LKMRFDILTLFPHLFDYVLGESIIGRACLNGLIEVNAVNIRDYSQNRHRKVDDYPYGGGSGMIMTAQPIYDAYLSVIRNIDYKPYVIYMSPQGTLLDQKKVISLSKYKGLLIICGHYEGVDERVLEDLVDEEISIGDYVLTGGEIPAMVLIDAVSRLIPGVLANEESYSDESHFNGLLEYPQYTRPYEFNGRKVPDILLSGNHKKIAEWRKAMSLLRTRDKRPDLFERYPLTDKDRCLIEKYARKQDPGK
jgi:tRNA (guanine37-N1)-methyltransferase